MRPAAALALVALLLPFSGCASDEPPPATATTAATVPTAPTPTEPTAPPTDPTPPTPPEPVVVYEKTHDFQAEPAATPKVERFNVTAGATTLRVNVTIESSGLVGFTGHLSVRIRDASGAEVLECVEETCVAEVPSPQAGSWQVEYTGAGTARAHVRIAQI